MFEVIYPTIKTSVSADHVFFLNGPFSQWHNSKFAAELPTGEPLRMSFHCGEQYMMACKAVLMHDYSVLEMIMSVQQTSNWHTAPKAIKELGRKISNWNQQLWDDNCEEIVYQGNLARFRDNPILRNFMFAFGDRTFVEGAHYDPVWGVGLAWDDPKIIHPGNWRGANKLGKALNRVRDTLRGEAIGAVT